MITNKFISKKPFPYLLEPHVGVDTEANTSIIARVSWMYRIKPNDFLSNLIVEKNYRPGLRDLAGFSNSLTKGSAHVSSQLYFLTGHRYFGSYVNLSSLIGGEARGLISHHKKWCRFCYEESMLMDRSLGVARVADELYWSLSMSRFCHKHRCTLSDRCGKCFMRQPYISSLYEPGFCHSCGASLAKSVCHTFEDDEQESVVRYLSEMDIFLPEHEKNHNLNMGIFSANIRLLIRECGENGVPELAQCLGIAESTLRDWCKEKHLLSLDSLMKVIKGLSLPRASNLFDAPESFLSSVDPQLNKQFNFNVKRRAKSAWQEIAPYISEILSGAREPETRKSIADRFEVSVGMLENAFKSEMTLISRLYQQKRNIELNDFWLLLNKEMDAAVRRCGSRMRSFDWEHILPQLNKSLDLSAIDIVELDKVRKDSILKYLNSDRRDKSRDVSRLMPDHLKSDD